MEADNPEDPHIHVAADLGADAAARDLIASTFRRAGDLANVVATGCGANVPRAMTSIRPEAVTCLACREHAHTHHLQTAEQIVRLGSAPGSGISSEQVARLADWHRDLARRFAGG